MGSAEGGTGGGRRRRPRLRTGFILVVLLAVVAPMGVVGIWLTHTMQRSGEAVVRARLSESLDAMIPPVARAWERERAGLMRLVQTDEVQAALGVNPPPVSVPGDGTAETLPTSEGLKAAAWEALDPSVQRLVIRNLDGEIREVFDRGAPGDRVQQAASAAALLPVRFDVHEPWSGRPLGVAEAWIHAHALLPGDLILPAVSGALLGVFEPEGGASLLPLALEPELFERPHFDRAGERWVVTHRRLYEPPLILALAGPTAAVAEPLHDAARSGLVALLLVTVAGVLLTVVVSRRLTHSLGGLAEAADSVAAGQLDRRVPEAGPDEVHRLSSAFNAMTANLQQTLDQLAHHEALVAMGEMAASLAHEVRNPLTAMQVDLERVRRRIARREDGAEVLLDRVAAQIERLESSLSDALSLAPRGARVKEPVDLALTLRAAADAAAPRFAERGARFEFTPDWHRPVQVNGDAAVLERLFLNLLLNAADALPPEGRAGVRFEREGDVVRIEVWDEGTGIPPAVRARVLEPFYSTKPRGTGLGLPIAHRIARSHGGDLELESEPGVGTTVTVHLPVDRSGTIQPGARG